MTSQRPSSASNWCRSEEEIDLVFDPHQVAGRTLLLVCAGLREKLHLDPTNRSEGRAIGDPILGVFECFVGGEGLEGDPLNHEAEIRRNGVLHRPMHLGLGSTPIDQAENGGDCSGVMRLFELGDQLVRGAWRGLPRPRGPQQSTQEPADHDPREHHLGLLVVRWRAMAHPVITAQMSAQTPNVTLHTPSGGRHNPTRQGRGPGPTANHSTSTVVPPSSTAARRSFQRVTPSTWNVIIAAAANRAAASAYAIPAGTCTRGLATQACSARMSPVPANRTATASIPFGWVGPLMASR